MPKTARTKANRENPSDLTFRAAFDATAAERAALAEEDLLPLNLDVTVALTKVLGALPQLAKMRSAIAESLPRFDLTRFDRLETYAKALAYAQGSLRAAPGPEESLTDLAARASEIRKQLLTDGRALARRGFLDARRFDALKRTTGYLAIASDIAVLVRVLRERWDEVRANSAIKPAELDEALSIFERMTNAYAARKSAVGPSAAATLDRQRAYTLLVRTYDQARRAAIYLRWSEDDADRLVPSLWAKRGRRSPRAKKRKEMSAAQPAASPPAHAEGGPPASQGLAASTRGSADPAGVVTH